MKKFLKILSVTISKIKLARQMNKLAESLKNSDSPEQKLKRGKNAVIKLREGLMNSHYENNMINQALEARWSYQDLKITKDEVIAFRNGESQKILARKILSERRTETNDYGLCNIITDLAEKGYFTLSEIGTNETELHLFNRRCMKKIYQGYINALKKVAQGEKLSSSESDPDFLYNRIITNIKESRGEYNFTLKEFEISGREMRELRKMAHLETAKTRFEWLKNHAKEGNTVYGYIIEQMYNHLEKAKANLVDIGLTEEIIKKTIREIHFQAAKEEFEVLKNHTDDRPGFTKDSFGDSEKIAARIRENLEKAQKILIDLEISEEQLNDFVKTDYIYLAQFLLKKMRHDLKDSENIIELKRYGKCHSTKASELYPAEEIIESIIYFANKAGITLEKIKTSKKELYNLKTVLD